VTTYRGTVPDRPVIATGLRGEGAFTGRPARAGDVVEVPCPWQMDWVNMGTDCGKGCAKCDGKQVVNVRLTEDPRAEMWMTATPTIGGWLIVGTIE
jgi:hypothetical protein